MSNSTDAKPLSAAELAEVRIDLEAAQQVEPAYTTQEVQRLLATIDERDESLRLTRNTLTVVTDNLKGCREENARLLATLDSLTARSSEITDEAVVAAANERFALMTREHFGFIAGAAWALEAAEATRAKP